MHILVLTHYYPPEVNAPASRIYEMARAWVGAGETVTIVTCAPNHPRGKIFPGYRNRFAREETDGIAILRLPTFLAANAGFGRRLLNYLSYPLSLLFHLPRLPKPDLVLATSPQFFCGLSGLLLKRRRRPWVLEIRDLWPESIVAVGAMRRGAVIRLLERIESFAYRKADALVSVTDSFVPHLLAGRGGRGPIEVIKNGVDLSVFAGGQDLKGGERLKRELGLEGKFVAAYVGTHGMAHGLDIVLEAAARLRGHENIAFLLVGDGSERDRLEREAKRQGLINVRFAGQRPKSDMPAIWQATDVSLVLLRRLETFKSVLPSKMFEAMAMRRPIILGLEGEARSLLEAAGAGVAITPEDADELVESLLRLASDPAEAAAMGGSGHSFVVREHDRSVLARRYLEFLRGLTDSRRRSAA